MCNSTVPQQASLLTHNLYPVNSAAMVYFFSVIPGAQCTDLPVVLNSHWVMDVLTDLWLSDHGGFAVAEGRKREAELNLFISLEKTQSPRQHVSKALKWSV